MWKRYLILAILSLAIFFLPAGAQTERRDRYKRPHDFLVPSVSSPFMSTKEYRNAHEELERDFWAYTHTDENSDRVGEFAIGTNIGVERVIGNILQDEKFPGIHIAFGDPYGAHTGAPWKSSTHIDVVGLEFSIWLGDAEGEEQIMRDGQFLIDA